jgi:hypothetical protein
VPSSPNQTVPYLGLTLGQYPGAPKNRKAAAADGVYHQGVLVIRWRGGAWDIKPWVKVVLWSDRTGGRFSGRMSDYPHTALSGTFSCS